MLDELNKLTKGLIMKFVYFFVLNTIIIFMLGCSTQTQESNLSVEENFNPLHLAVRNKPLNEIQLLIDSGASINATDGMNQTSLHHAVLTEREDVVKLLVDSGADVNAKSSTGNTPLLVASILSDLASMKLLLDFGADPNIKNNNGETALSIIVKNEKHLYTTNEMKIEFAVAKNLLLNSKDGVQGVDNNKDNVFSVFVDKYSNVDFKDDIEGVASFGKLTETSMFTIKNLFKEHLFIGQLEKRNVLKANIETIEYLTINRSYFGSMLHKLEAKGYGPKSKPDETINRPKLKPLSNMPNSREDYYLNIIPRLLETGLSPQYTLSNGESVLQWAVKNNFSKVVDLLLLNGAKINYRKRNSLPVLHIAVIEENISILKILFDSGVEVNEVDQFGRTALFYAFPANFQPLQDRSFITYLVSKGANPTLRDNNGLTANGFYNQRRNEFLVGKVNSDVAERKRIAKIEEDKYQEKLRKQQAYIAQQKRRAQDKKKEHDAWMLGVNIVNTLANGYVDAMKQKSANEAAMQAIVNQQQSYNDNVRANEQKRKQDTQKLQQDWEEMIQQTQAGIAKRATKTSSLQNELERNFNNLNKANSSKNNSNSSAPFELTSFCTLSAAILSMERDRDKQIKKLGERYKTSNVSNRESQDITNQQNSIYNEYAKKIEAEKDKCGKSKSSGSTIE